MPEGGTPASAASAARRSEPRPRAYPVAAVAKGFVRHVAVRLLWQLLEKEKTAKVEFRQQAQILFGTSTKFTSGQVIGL